MKIKQFLKTCKSVICHPIVGGYLLFNGSRMINIGNNISINRLRFLRCGESISIGRDARFLFIEKYYGGKYDPSIVIGNNVFITNSCSFLSAAPIEIDDNCLIASDVLITSENHGINPELSDSYSNIPLQAKAVHIGKGCWLGEKVSILPGVTLGERCIVAANAVVTKSFPAYSMIGGVPAKLIMKYDFESHEWIRTTEVRE